MKTITIFLWCLVGLVLGTVVALGQNPTPIANLQRATTVYTTNIIPVVTNPGQTNGTKGIELDDFLASLVGFPGWPSVSVTNAIGTVKTNGATLTASATSINFVQGSNTVLRATNSAGAVSIEINAAASGSASVNTNLQLQSLKVFGNQTNVGNLAFGTNYYWTDSGVNTLQLVDPKRGGAALTFEGSDGGITFGINATATPYIDVVAPLNVYESFNLPGHNVAVGRVWTATNASTGAGEWQAVGGGGGSGTDLHVFTNGALALISTNINFQTGITGAVSGTTVNLGIDSRALNWAVVASTTNVNGVSNYVGSVSNALWAGDNSVSNYVGSVSNLTQTKQAGNAVLTNLVGTVARNVTNVVSLSTSNATSKPLSNSYATGTLTLFGLEAGANVTITPNASNLVIAATSGGSVSATNVPNLTVTNAINEVEYSPTSSGTNLTIDLARSGNIAVTLTTNVHILFTNVQSGVKASRLKLSQDATGGWSVLSATVSGGLLRTNGNPWQFMGTTAGDEAHWWFGTSQATNVWIYQEQPKFNLAGGWGIAVTTNAGAVSSSLTNRTLGIATNATSATVGFSDAESIQIYNVGWHLKTNLVLSPTNLVPGRTIAIYCDTNSLSYDLSITNTAGNAVSWNLNVSTNGSTAVTKTNSLRAQIFLTAQTNGTITAERGYYR